MPQPRRILIAGIGNIFFGDDAFGCEVVRRLMHEAWPEGVTVRDFGIRGLDLVYALEAAHDHVILIDAVPLGRPPGTLYVIAPDLNEIDSTGTAAADAWDAHAMNPVNVLRMARSSGVMLNDVLLIGCEPIPFDLDADMTSELSDAVRTQLEQAVRLTAKIVWQLSRGEKPDFQGLDVGGPSASVPALAGIAQVKEERI
ncbi:MAG TPA: hydrogenase maturation protease [Pirellulales bacterium]|nr:hydrogenase maturation protease [Pirellulales bacterium]